MPRQSSTAPNKVRVFATRVSDNKLDTFANIRFNDSKGEVQEVSAVFSVQDNQLQVEGITSSENTYKFNQVQNINKQIQKARENSQPVDELLDELDMILQSNSDVNRCPQEQGEENEDTSQSPMAFTDVYDDSDVVDEE